MTEEVWVDVVGAAAHLATTPAAIRKAVQRGWIPAYQWGRNLRFKISELDAVLTKRPRRRPRRVAATARR